MLEKRLAHCTTPESTSLMLVMLYLQISDAIIKRIITVISAVKLPNTQVQCLTEFQVTSCWMAYFLLWTLFLTDPILKACRYSNHISECSDMLHTLVPPIQSFTVKNLYTTYTSYTYSNHTHSPSIPIVSRKHHSESFFLTTPVTWNRFSLGWFSERSLQKILQIKNLSILIHNIIIYSCLHSKHFI